MIKSFTYELNRKGFYTNKLKIKAQCDKCHRKFTVKTDSNVCVNEKRERARIEELARLCYKCRGPIKMDL